MSEVVIADAARTPHGELLGALADASAVDLGRAAIEGLLSRTPATADVAEWVGLGNSIQAGVGQVPARTVAVEAGLPVETPATTINEASGSGLRAIALAVDRIEAGRIDGAVAGGFESMSNAPHVTTAVRKGRRHGNVDLVDSMVHDALWDPHEDAHMGTLTEALADRFDISRAAQDEYALESNRRAGEAVESGTFDDETVPVEAGGQTVERDEGPRPDTSLDALGDLPPAFEEGGTVTAGNASKLNDGAGAVLVADADVADERGFDPLASVVDYVAAYRDPKWFGMSVGDAVEQLLDRNDLDVADVDHFELNEAFAAQMVYVRDRLDLPPERHNPLGGAVALGHPIGASGGILTTTLAHAMAREDHDRGIVGMSVGGGGGIAVLLER